MSRSIAVCVASGQMNCSVRWSVTVHALSRVTNRFRRKSHWLALGQDPTQTGSVRRGGVLHISKTIVRFSSWQREPLPPATDIRAIVFRCKLRTNAKKVWHRMETIFLRDLGPAMKDFIDEVCVGYLLGLIELKNKWIGRRKTQADVWADSSTE